MGGTLPWAVRGQPEIECFIDKDLEGETRDRDRQTQHGWDRERISDPSAEIDRIETVEITWVERKRRVEQKKRGEASKHVESIIIRGTGFQ